MSAPEAAPEATPAERRGRPRGAATDTIVETVLNLLEGGVTIGELSIERIAREAGVGKATVYRRWTGKDALMLDVMRSLEEPIPPLAGVSVRDDLVTLVDFIRRRGLAKRSSAMMRNVVAQFQGSPGLWQLYHDTVVRGRREAMHEVLRRGTRTGEVRADADVELLADLFAGPMLARAMLHQFAPLDETLSARIVDTVLEGVRPRN